MLRGLALSFTCRSLVLTTAPCCTGCGSIPRVRQGRGKGSNAAFDVSCEGTGREVMWIQGTQGLLICVFPGAEMWKGWLGSVLLFAGGTQFVCEGVHGCHEREDVKSQVREDFFGVTELRFLNLSLENYCIQFNLCHPSLELSFTWKQARGGEEKLDLPEGVKGLFWVWT